jgi:hypothetical protein
MTRAAKGSPNGSSPRFAKILSFQHPTSKNLPIIFIMEVQAFVEPSRKEPVFFDPQGFFKTT